MADNDSNDMTCQICLKTLTEDALLPLDNCEHVFHEACLISYLEGQVN